MIGGRLNLWQARVVTSAILLATVVGLWLLSGLIGNWVILPIVLWTVGDAWCLVRYKCLGWDWLCIWLQRERTT